MSTGNVINIGTRVDLGSLRSGMAQAEAAVKQASQNMAEAQAQFGAAASQGNLQAIAALKQYESELRQAQAEVARFASAEQASTSALQGGTSARMAASAELRVLEGNFMGSTRAAGAFLTMLPGVGAAMQIAFPVFGVIALVEILYRGVEALTKWNSALQTLGATEKSVHDQMVRDANDEYEMSTKLVSSEFNIAIAKAASPIEKDRIRVEMQAALVSLSGKHVENLKAAMAQLEGSGVASKIAADNLASMAKSSLAMGNIGQAAAMAILSHVSAGQAQAAYTPGKNGDPSEIEKNHREIENAQAELNNAQAKGIEDGQKITKQGIKDQKTVDEERLRQMEADFAAQKAAGDTSIFAERNYWQAKLSAFTAGSQQYLSVLNRVAALSGEVHKLEPRPSSGIRSSKPGTTKSPTGSWRLHRRRWGKSPAIKQRTFFTPGSGGREYNDEVLRAAEIDSQNAASFAEVNLKIQEAERQVSEHSAAVQLAAIHAKDYTDKLKELDAALKRVAADESLTPVQKATQSQGTQNQIAQLGGQQAAQGAQDTAAITQSIANPYIQAFDQINNSWLQMQNKLIFGTRNIGKAFANMGGGLVEDAAQAAERWGAHWVEKEIMTLIFHQVTNEQKAASDAVALAQAKAIAAASNVSQVMSLAAVAAAGGAASQAGIPIIGPELAVAAAASMFALTSAYAPVAAFETGGIIPNTGIAMVHQGEAVLPRNLTNMLMSTANDNSSSSSVRQENHFHGMSDRAFSAQMMRNANGTVKALQRGLRNKGRA